MSESGPDALLTTRLSALWTRLLDIPAVASTDNFFSLGGHSLLLIRLVADVQEEFGVTLDPNQVLEDPTLCGIARQISQLSVQVTSNVAPPVPLGHVRKRVAVSQENHWVFGPRKLRPYSMYYEARIHGVRSVERLAQSFAATVDNNRVFKYIFERSPGGEIYAVPYPHAAPLEVIDLRDLATQAQDAQIRAHRQRIFGSDFDIWREPALRAAYLRLGELEGVVLFCANHILLDLESSERFFTEFYARYGGAEVAEKAFDFYDLAVWERSILAQQRPADVHNYWLAKLQPFKKILRFSGRERPNSYIGRAATDSAHIDDPALLSFARLADDYLPPASIKVLAAISLGIFSQYGETPLAILYPVSVRDHPAAADVVGNFTWHNLFIVDIDQDITTDAWLSALQRQFLDDVAHRKYGTEDKERLLPASVKGSYWKTQIRYQYYDAYSVDADTPAQLRVQRPLPRFETVLTDLHFFVSHKRAALDIRLVYFADLFAPEEVSRLLTRVSSALDALRTRREQPLKSLIDALRQA